MKRVLVIALLAFLAGMALLLWLERSPQGVLPLPEPTTPGPSPEAGTGEVIHIPGPRAKFTEIQSSGPLSVIDAYPETGVRRYLVTARDHRSLGAGAVDGEDLLVLLYGTDGSTLLRSLKAKRGRVHLEFVRGRPQLATNEPGTFQDVTVRAEAGLEFAPLEITLPVVEAVFGPRTLRSEEPVVVTGRGLRADGVGLFADGLSGLLRIERDPVVVLELADGSQARLVAAGPLTFVDRPDQGVDLVELLAAGGATLTLEGEDPVQVKARELHLYGRLRPEDDRFVPERIDAEGAVELRRSEGSFFGDRGQVIFGPQGKPRRGELRGSPRAEVLMRGVTFEGRERVEDPAASLPIEAAGDELLTVQLGASSRFELDGPARVRLPTLDTLLEAQGSIRGGREAGGAYDTVTADGGVRVTGPTETLEAETVDVEALPGRDGEVFARVTTQGSTHMTGDLEGDRGSFDLLARGGLVYTRHGQEFHVPRADGVELTVLGRNAFRFGALQVRDLNGLTGTFEAEGDVWFENAIGRGTGERLIAHGPRHAEIFGVPGRPAHFEVPEGELSAQRVELDGTRLFAEGSVHSEFTSDDTRVSLDARWVDIDEGRTAGGGLEGSDWRLDAGGDVRASVVSPLERHDLSADLLRLRANDAPDARRVSGQGPGRLEPLDLEARGNVVADYSGIFVIHARGERLFVDKVGNAQLTPAPGERVQLEADDHARGLHFELDAALVDYGLERLVALRPDLTVDGLDLPVLGASIPGDQPRLHAVAGRMALDRRSMLLSESSYVARVSPLAQGWSLDAEQILLTGDTQADTRADARPSDTSGLPLDGPFKELYAWGGFVASGDGALQARGERMAVSSVNDRITITGYPASVVGNGVTWYSDWFELEGARRSLRSAAGEMHTHAESQRGPWVLRYASMEPIEQEDATIQVLREPTLRGAEEELRAAWALFWVDARRWQQLSGVGAGEIGETGERRAGSRMNSLFGEVAALGSVEWLQEFYMEGNVEYIVRGDSRARAEAIYLDLVDGQGWVREADIETDMPIEGVRTPIKVHADWLRHSADGVYRAENAVATSCAFEDPHYVVQIGSFNMRPRSRGSSARAQPAAPSASEAPSEPADATDPVPAAPEVFDGWDIEAKHNRLVLWRNLAIPLPKIGFPVDPDYKVDADAVSVFGMRPLSFGQDARFGTFVGTSFDLDLSWLLSWINLAFDVPEGAGGAVQGGRGDLHVRWLNQRGLLLGIDIPIYDPGRFWLDTKFSGIADTGKDKGLVRVPEEERGLYRGWYRARGRYLLGDREWIDGVVTYQTDPGFQSEFSEGSYVTFEERETFLHWRRASGDRVIAATVEGQLDDFHTEVMEQPAAIFLDGRSQVASLGDLPVYYGSKTTVGQYVRIEDQEGYELPFADGLGERTVSRLDTLHRVETPIDLGLAGLRATPWVDGRVTAWSQGADSQVNPLRGGVLAGAELATTLFRFYEGGALHAVTPSLGVRTDLATADDDTALVPIDTTELPLQGTFVDVGLRSRWTYSERRDALDIAVTATHVEDSPAYPDNGWTVLGTRGSWLSSMLGVPYVLTCDLRYDPDDHLTAYSRTVLAIEPIPSVDIELGHNFGREPATLAPLFDATSIGARYYFSKKWELEGRQVFANQGEGRLASQLGIRRIGHDFVLELTTRFVAGEGQGFGIEFTPLLTWNSSGFSVLDSARRHGL